MSDTVQLLCTFKKGVQIAPRNASYPNAIVTCERGGIIEVARTHLLAYRSGLKQMYDARQILVLDDFNYEEKTEEVMIEGQKIEVNRIVIKGFANQLLILDYDETKRNEIVKDADDRCLAIAKSFAVPNASIVNNGKPSQYAPKQIDSPYIKTKETLAKEAEAKAETPAPAPEESNGGSLNPKGAAKK